MPVSVQDHRPSLLPVGLLGFPHFLYYLPVPMSTSSMILFTLKMEAIWPSETSVSFQLVHDVTTLKTMT